MRILKYKNSSGYVGYMGTRNNYPVFIYLDIPRDRGTSTFGVDEYTVSDPDLYKVLIKMAQPESNQDYIDLYFQYIDMKYEAYDYT